jgi:hypothetical protein
MSSKTKTVQRLVRNSPLVTDLAELKAHPPALPRPHRPTPMGELSWPRKVRRVGGFLFFLSSIALAVSASTASSDWNVKSEDYLKS